MRNEDDTEVKSIEWFERHRPEHYQFVRDQIERCKRHAIISMGVKVGKKEVVLIQSRRTVSEPATVRHVLITNFSRIDCQEQREELKAYGIDTFYGKELEDSVPHIKQLVRDGLKVIVHVDELDFGAGDEQRMSRSFRELRTLAIRAIGEVKDYVSLRLYSATAEEAIYSEFANEAEKLVMPDPPSFFGPDDYLDAGLVEEAQPFWDGPAKRLSPQGEEACRYWIEDTVAPFAVLRVATSNTKDPDGVTYLRLRKSKEFRDQLAMFGITPYFVDGHNRFFWGKPDEKPIEIQNWWGMYSRQERNLIVINQTFSRSTLMGFHPLVAFLHDYRRKNTPYSTVAQAQLRVVHYPYQPHDKFWPDPSVSIKVFGCVNTFKLAAGRITTDEFVQLSGREKLGARVNHQDERLSDDPSHYHEYHAETEKEVWELAKQHGFETPNATWALTNGEYVSTIREVRKRWTKAEIDVEKFYGLEKHRKNRRSIAYYLPDGTVRFRLVVHDGITEQARSQTKRSQYNVVAA